MGLHSYANCWIEFSATHVLAAWLRALQGDAVAQHILGMMSLAQVKMGWHVCCQSFWSRITTATNVLSNRSNLQGAQQMTTTKNNPKNNKCNNNKGKAKQRWKHKAKMIKKTKKKKKQHKKKKKKNKRNKKKRKMKRKKKKKRKSRNRRNNRKKKKKK